MCRARILCVGLASAAVLIGACSVARAQTYFYRWDNGSGNNSWGTGQNWGLNPPQNLGVNNVTPSAFFEEQGLINNGNTVNVTTVQTQFSGSAPDSAVAAAGVTVDGVTAPGNGSTLNITGNGNLSLLVTYGPNGAPPSPTPTAGTGNATLSNGGMLNVQPGGILTAQGDIIVNNGRLTVGGIGIGAGGQATASNLRVPNANGTVHLSGTAFLTAKNGAVLNGTTTIAGPGVAFHTPSISMSASAVFNPVIIVPANPAGTGHSVINVTGGVSLNGTLRPQFQDGVVPQLGDTWTLWDCAQVQGNFTASDTTAPGAELPTGLRYAITTTTTGSVHGVKGQLTVENFLTAEVNRASGQVTIRNTNTTVGPGVTITGYQIGSPAGALRPTSFSSTFGGTWESTNLSANSITELNPTGSSTLGLGASASIGNVYDPVSLQTTFGTTPVSDLTFSYTRSDGRTVNAPITYIGTGLANTLVLQVDPTDGKARIVNDSAFNNIQFDGYQIASASASLMSTWNSLQDQAIAGWEEASATTGLLAELNPTTNTTVNAGQAAATMNGLFRTAGGVQDLTFQFRVPGTGPGTGVLNGIVRYLPFSTGLIGDYNGNGVVDAADYVVWRNSVGQTVALPNRNPDNVGPIGLQEYIDWRARFGNAISGSGALGASAVPEPSASALLVLSMITLTMTRQRTRFIVLNTIVSLPVLSL